jgi:outer membrane protein OmpA-like peptidoglycan-associated protein
MKRSSTTAVNKEALMSPRNKLNTLAFGLPAAVLAIGCAAATPPPELVNARSLYAQVHAGQAQELVPADVLAARQALEQAERSFQDDSDSQRTRDLSYIAQRKAMLAESRGSLAAAKHDQAGAEREVAQLRDLDARRTKTALAETRAEVSAQRGALAAQEQRLSAEQRARLEADRRAASALASLQALAAVKEEARGVVITLNGAVLFATGQSTLLSIAKDRLKQVADALNDNPTGTIVVEGHTDSTGAQSANEELSRRRAESVRAFLVQSGVDRDRIRAVGLGPSRPVAENQPPEGRANNRRVEIVIERLRSE